MASESKMRILVTGALGHIGSKFINSILPNEYDEVRMVDNLATQRYASLFNLPKGVNFNFIEKDIMEANLPAITHGVNVVVHLAAITDASSSFERQQEVDKINCEGTRKVANACIESGSCLLFPSTTSVYGSQSKIMDESASIDELKPQSPYAESKLKSEILLDKMGKNNGLKYTICRFGTIFGTSIGMRFHTAVNKFCWQAAMGQPISVWKTAMNQKRPYLGVDDSVRAIKHIINKNIFYNEIFNIVSSNNTVSEIVNIIRKSIPYLDLEFVHSEIMNQLSYEVLSDKIKEYNFNFRDRIDNGIRDTLKIISTKEE